ncbi:MAG: hypothetical protein IKI71_03430 [Lachnospiraceae bacterium]|nr:hypothetical protein [Lachnospiraceae bacterium]
MQQLVKDKITDVISTEIDAKILEYEKNHKNCSGKYYTVDEMNDMINKVISKYE